MSGLALSALGLLVIQIVMGFPLQQAVLAIERQDAVQNREPAGRVTAASPAPGMRFHYTCWFGLALCSLAGVVAVECVNLASVLRRRGRSQ
jgi:hypothetical protein